MFPDLRLAWRGLKAQPALALTALATFAVGIGATTAMYSVVHGVLLRPLPYHEPDRIVRLWEVHPGAPVTFQRHWLSNVTLEAWRPRATAVSAFAGYSQGTDTVGRENPDRVVSATVSASLFQVLGVRPLMGRFLEPSDETEGASDVVVLSHAYWRTHLGASPDAVGQPLLVNGRSHTVVGVAPPDFAFPGPDAMFWRPDVMSRDAAAPGRVRVISVIGRLAEGTTVGAAAQEGTTVAQAQPRPPAADLIFGKGGPVEVRAEVLASEMTASVRPALVVATAGVLVVLLLASANVANLFLSRGVSRERDLAVRAVLGAGAFRLVRQALSESLLLSAAGGLLGVGLAWSLIRVFPRVAPRGFPRLDAVVLDGRVLLVTVVVTMASGLLAALAPAWRASRARATALNDGDRRTTGAAARRLRGALLVTEAALAVMLLVAAALIGRSLVRLLQVDPGYQPSGVLTADIAFPSGASSATHVMPRVDEILSAIRGLPGVVSAGGSNMGPLVPISALQMVTLRETTPDGQPIRARALSWAVTPGYMEALGMRLVAGRFLQPSDVGASTQAFLVNEEFVRQYWTDGRAVVGRRYPGLLHSNGTVAEVVGVVASVLKDGLDRPMQPELFVPAGTAERGLSAQVVIAVRTTGPPDAAAPMVRRAIAGVDSQVAVDHMSALTDKVSASVATPRFGASLLAGFAGVAVLLAVIGLYGTLSYGVSERRREMGVRAALGASRARIVGMVLREGLTVVLTGLVAGLAGAVAVSRLMAASLFGVTPLDPWSYLVAPAILLLVALAACLVPARRAARVEPAEALRCE
ncbi:MAG: ABC transporter permease [Acidobacteria bacterium]|nr:ABC transporter permease [Acidobacteriota bacterium]